jgi:uncharacterized protein (DUF58 family)
MALSSMHLANANLKNIELKRMLPHKAFANKAAQIDVVIENQSFKTRYAINIKLNGTVITEIKSIPAQSESLVSLDFTYTRRGRQKLPKLTCESLFPFDLLTIWRNYQSSDEVLVYPELKGQTTLPRNLGSAENSEQGLYLEHREYTKGDPIQRIDWRASAKHQDLLVKKFESQNKQQFSFSFSDLDSSMNKRKIESAFS